MTIAEELARIRAIPDPRPGEGPIARTSSTKPNPMKARVAASRKTARMTQILRAQDDDRRAIAGFKTMPGSALVSTNVVREVLGMSLHASATQVAKRTGITPHGGQRQGERWMWEVADVRAAMGRMGL